MSAPPCAPNLLSANDGILVELAHMPPLSSHAAIHVYKKDGATRTKHFFDAEKKELLPPGDVGTAVTIGFMKPGAAGHRVWVPADSLPAGVPFTATAAYRTPAAFAFGPESPQSAPFVPLLPPTPCAPVVEPVRSQTVKVKFCAPPRCCFVACRFSCGGNSFLALVKPDKIGLSPYKEPFGEEFLARWQGFSQNRKGPGAWGDNGQGELEVYVHSNDMEYEVSIAAYNGVGGAFSPWSAPTKIRILDHAPPTPCAPVLEEVTEDSVRLYATAPPGHADALAAFAFSSGTEKKWFNGTGLSDVETFVPIPRCNYVTGQGRRPSRDGVCVHAVADLLRPKNCFSPQTTAGRSRSCVRTPSTRSRCAYKTTSL